LFIAEIAGVDTYAVMNGAYSVLQRFFKSPLMSEPFQHAALMHTISHKYSKDQTVLMTYVDALQPFTRWQQQLWAESLGKDGKGSTPITARGAVDQHSQLQLYLDGPKNKQFTLILNAGKADDAKISEKEAHLFGVEYLSDCSLSDLIRAEQSATVTVLHKNNCPVRTVSFEALTPQVLGELMMSAILETIITSLLLGVNCFDQPAVEQGKKLTKEYLRASK
jgi:glucose-6-phosphate isomerase